MSHGVIIRNGTIVDGTGRDAYVADVAIDGDRITAIGDLEQAAARLELDAAGLIVSPGFIDLHTHLDAQVGWDPYMTSSSWHGVTTVLMGNCGVTFAPARPNDKQYLADMMQSVEDIPADAILGGLDWDWETYPQYLDAVERLRPALNVVGLVGHCAVRYHVMRERSLTDETPTARELDTMRAIVEESVAGGAVGFSTSRILLHRVPDGRYVPGTLAPIGEYLAIAEGMNAAGGGLFQAINDFATKPDHELRLLREMAAACGDVLFSGGVGNGGFGIADTWGDFLRQTRAQAGRITLATMCRPSGSLCGLAQIAPVKGSQWKALMGLPTIADRVAALNDATTRELLVEEGKRNGMWYDPEHIHPLGVGASPEYQEAGGMSVADHARALGVHPIEFVVDRLLASDGRELFNTWFFNRAVDQMPALLASEHVYPGLADTGAHAGQICDADASTNYLAYWHRERGTATLPQAVHKLTGQAAAVLGLVDRGRLEVGSYADVNVFDIDALASEHPTYANDFPGGAGRFMIGSRGYAVTMVNGEVVAEHGRHTGARPGTVLRSFRRGTRGSI